MQLHYVSILFYFYFYFYLLFGILFMHDEKFLLVMRIFIVKSDTQEY